MTLADELAGVIRYLERLEPLPPTPPTEVTKATAAQWREAASRLLTASNEFASGADLLRTLAERTLPTVAAQLDKDDVANAEKYAGPPAHDEAAQKRGRVSALCQLAQHLGDEASSLHDRALLLGRRANAKEVITASGALKEARAELEAVKVELDTAKDKATAARHEARQKADALTRTLADARTRLTALSELVRSQLSPEQTAELRTAFEAVLAVLAVPATTAPDAQIAEPGPHATPHPAGLYAAGRVEAAENSLEVARGKVEACTEDAVTSFINDLDCLAEQALNLRLEIGETLHG